MYFEWSETRRNMQVLVSFVLFCTLSFLLSLHSVALNSKTTPEQCTVNGLFILPSLQNSNNMLRSTNILAPFALSAILQFQLFYIILLLFHPLLAKLSNQ